VKISIQELSSSWDVRLWPQKTWAEKKVGAAVPFCGGAASPSNTMWPGPRSTFIQWRFQPSSRMATIDMNRKLGGCAPFKGGEHHLGWGLPPYQVASSSIQPFGHNRHRPKIGRGLCPFFWDDLGPHRTQSRWAEAYLHTKWHLSPDSRWATMYIGQKLGEGLCPFKRGAAGSPSNTKSTGLRPTSIPSGILMHPAVWPQ